MSAAISAAAAMPRFIGSKVCSATSSGSRSEPARAFCATRCGTKMSVGASGGQVGVLPSKPPQITESCIGENSGSLSGVSPPTRT